LLLDDFITDFDKERVERCLALITSLQCQVFFTSPIESDTITKRIDAQRIDL
jgi:recombinational DNA repair ATPase RecF